MRPDLCATPVHCANAAQCWHLHPQKCQTMPCSKSMAYSCSQVSNSSRSSILRAAHMPAAHAREEGSHMAKEHFLKLQQEQRRQHKCYLDDGDLPLQPRPAWQQPRASPSALTLPSQRTGDLQEMQELWVQDFTVDAASSNQSGIAEQSHDGQQRKGALSVSHRAAHNAWQTYRNADQGYSQQQEQHQQQAHRILFRHQTPWCPSPNQQVNMQAEKKQVCGVQSTAMLIIGHYSLSQSPHLNMHTHKGEENRAAISSTEVFHSSRRHHSCTHAPCACISILFALVCSFM